MIDISAIRSGFRTILLGIVDPNMPSSDDIAFENRDYDPVVGTAYIRETLIPGVERKVAFAEIQAVGIMQYDLIWPAGKGTEDAEALADVIKNSYAPDTAISDHSVVYRAERFQAQSDKKWYVIPVRMTYRAFATSVLGNCSTPVASSPILDELGDALLDETSDGILEG